MHRKRTSKKVMLGAIAAAATLVASACGSSSSTSGGGHDTTVSVWSWRAQDAGMWKKVQAALDSKGDHIKIDFTSDVATSYDSILETAMDGGKGPDIFYDRAGELTKTFAAAKLISPLKGTVDFSDISKAALPSVTWEGKYYGVPLDEEVMVVLYNKQLIQKYHLTVPPSSWNQWLDEMKELKQKGLPGLYVMGVQPWMQALQFDAVAASALPSSFPSDLVAKKANYTSAPYVSALAQFQQLAPYLEPKYSGVGSADDEQQVALALDKSAFDIDGNYDVLTITKTNPDIQLGEFLVPSPTPSGHPRIDWYPDAAMSLNSHISSPAVAKATKEIMAYTSSRGFGEDFTDIDGEISPIAGVTIPKSDPLAQQDYTWFQKDAVNPIFDINSDMDTPPPNVKSLSDTKLSAPQGVFDAEQAVMLPLLEKKLTPQEAAKKVESIESWYFAK
jgi:raffinose/stachyose/melibiose transport system substrate-binding protein